MFIFSAHREVSLISNQYHGAPNDLPFCRDLDPRLQAALQQYLVARGVNSNLATSILHHFLQKERSQYVNWLKTLEERFTKDR
jgi:complement component 1 Q subcomponent-binding protein, mitochondrial